MPLSGAAFAAQTAEHVGDGRVTGVEAVFDLLVPGGDAANSPAARTWRRTGARVRRGRARPRPVEPANRFRRLRDCSARACRADPMARSATAASAPAMPPDSEGLR